MPQRVLRAKNTEQRKNPYAPVIDQAILLLFASVMAWYYNGGSALRLICLAVLAALAADLLSALLLKAIYKAKNPPLDLPGSLFSGAITALLLPADFSLVPVLLIVFLSVIAVRVLYPVITRKPTLIRSDGLSAALVALSVLTLIFPRQIFAFPIPDALSGAVSPETGLSALKILSAGDSSAALRLGAVNLLIGNVAGPMGSTCLLLMLTAFLYRLIRRPSSCVYPAAFLMIVLLSSLLLPRGSFSAAESLLLELSGGTALFLSIFVFCDTRYLPDRLFFQALFGVAAGIVTMLSRRIPLLEDGACLIALGVNIVSEILARSSFMKKPKKGAPGRRRWQTAQSDEAYLDQLANEKKGQPE